MLTDEEKVGLHVALTPTWNETAYFADYILPMGIGSERHDIHSYETHDAQWIGFRQPVLRAARERRGETVTDTRGSNPGEVWEENEFWIDLSWRIDPDGALGIRKYFESKKSPGDKLTVDEYYGYIFENSVPGLPETASSRGARAARVHAALRRLRGRSKGRREVRGGGPRGRARGLACRRHRSRLHAKRRSPPRPTSCPCPSPDGDAEGRRRVGVEVDGQVLRGFPTPSGRLEFYSSTLARWGWPEYALPAYIESHVHPSQPRRGRDAAHRDVPASRSDPHPQRQREMAGRDRAHEPALAPPAGRGAARKSKTGDLVRVETRIGHFVVKAWVTEGIRPGVVACSHHMGRWKLAEEGQRQLMATVALEHEGTGWSLNRKGGVERLRVCVTPTRRASGGPTRACIRTSRSRSSPIRSRACTAGIRRCGSAEAEPDGSLRRRLRRHREVARPVQGVAREVALGEAHLSPDGTRRPYWLLRPLKPTKGGLPAPMKETGLLRALSSQPLRADLLAGLTVALVGLPQCLAYAMMSGLPPAYGIVTAAVPGLRRRLRRAERAGRHRADEHDGPPDPERARALSRRERPPRR